MMFRDRQHAGRELAARLRHLSGTSPLVLGLPRGGVPVAAEVARALSGELDVWIVRKIGAPLEPELALGAVAEEGDPIIDWQRARWVGAEREEVLALADAERAEVLRRVARYRGGRPSPTVQGRTVILVDDGIATGSTVEAAAISLRAHAPARLVLGAPVAPVETLERLGPFFDEVVCVEPLRFMFAISMSYEEFGQLRDADVVDILARERARSEGPAQHP